MKPRETYYEYWGLTTSPFDNVPDPNMYFDGNSSVDGAVSETLFAIDEGNESLVVIVGDVGLGKTMALRVILHSLNHDRYLIAFLTNPDMTFTYLIKEIIGQFQRQQCLRCLGDRRDPVQDTFNHLLCDAHQQGKRVLIFIDEANAMKSSHLESLRLLTNMQRENENLLTVVLAGQLELARQLEKPKHANLFQRIGVYCRLKKLETPDLMREYILHRLERAGAAQSIFTDSAYDVIWEHADQGVPRLVNKIAKLALKAGQTEGAGDIDATVVHRIGSRFGRASSSARQERRVRTKRVALVEEAPTAAVFKNADQPGWAGVPLAPVETADAGCCSIAEPETIHDERCGEPDVVISNGTPLSIEPIADVVQLPLAPVETADAGHCSIAEQEPVHDERRGETDIVVPDDTPVLMPDGTPLGIEQIADVIQFPAYIYADAERFPMGERVRFAGHLATQVLKQNPRLIHRLGVGNDPVPTWDALRTIIIQKFEQKLNSQKMSLESLPAA